MSVIGPRPGLWNQDILTAERDKYNANDVKPGLTGSGTARILLQRAGYICRDEGTEHTADHQRCVSGSTYRNTL